MPTNSFNNFFLSWRPDKSKLLRPAYLSLANLLESDIISGKLASGTRLPPQRELADFLDLNFTTVTAAYNLCREKNLIYGITGKGTFVSPLPGVDAPGISRNSPAYMELGVVKGFDFLQAPVIEATEKVLKKSYLNKLYSYTEVAGHLHQRAAGAHYMAQMDVHTDSSHTAIFSGAQNVISTAFLSLFRIGDTVVADEYTYSNLIGTAKLSHIRLVPVKGDENGMLPEELDKLCSRIRPRGIFLMPNCANPTTITITEERKDSLAEIIRKYDLILIEDDNTGAVPPISTLSHTEGRAYRSMFTRLPEQVLHICNSTMALCSGLRVAFAAFPERFRECLLNALFHLNIKTSSLDAEIMTELILSGKAAKILEQKRNLAQERNHIFDSVFPQEKNGTEGAFFRWMKLPELSISGIELERELMKKNVNIYHSYRFALQRYSAGFLRFAISSPESGEELEKALYIVRDLLEKLARK